MQPALIDTDTALLALLERLAPSEWITVDTEFVRERTYFGQLCLVQIGNATEVACIDALAIPLQPLWDFLADTARVKVMHSASQDMELFFQHSGACPQPLFDTQIAASLLGIGDQISYAALVSERLGITLDKSQSRTDWSQRPLKAAQLEYAADDVRQLSALYPALRDALDAAGRSDWLAQDCAALCDPARYRADPTLAWERLRGLGRLDADGQHAASALAQWRETRAIDRDRPRRWILTDEALLALAQARPTAAGNLTEVTGLPEKQVERNARAWLKCIAEAPTGLPPLVADFHPDAAHKALVKELSRTVRSRAEALGIPPGMLAARAGLERLARCGVEDSHPAFRGWRRDAVGSALQAVLDSRA